ncbi:MAG: hypothetical protein RLZZ488_1223 [Pseudomonadota bacterium]
MTCRRWKTVLSREAGPPDKPPQIKNFSRMSIQQYFFEAGSSTSALAKSLLPFERANEIQECLPLLVTQRFALWHFAVCDLA